MEHSKGTMDSMDDQSPASQIRAADSDRTRVVEQLRSAHAEGRLDLAEYDERVQQAWAARTYGELEALTADLPQAQSPAARVTRDEVRSSRHLPHRGRGGRVAVAAWAGASVINLVIWVIVSLTTLSWIYPWWVWVAGPWGAVLLVGWLSGRGDHGRSSR